MRRQCAFIVPNVNYCRYWHGGRPLLDWITHIHSEHALDALTETPPASSTALRPTERRLRVPAFVHGLAYEDLPADVVTHAKRCLLDLVGVGAAGSQTRSARIGCDH